MNLYFVTQRSSREFCIVRAESEEAADNLVKNACMRNTPYFEMVWDAPLELRQLPIDGEPELLNIFGDGKWSEGKVE